MTTQLNSIQRMGFKTFNDNYSIGENSVLIDGVFRKMWSDMVSDGMKNPNVASVTDSRIFKQMNNTGLYKLDIMEVVGAGKWANRQEKEDVKKSAPKYVNFGSYCAEEYADDLPVSIWVEEMNSPHMGNQMATHIRKWVAKARKADERNGFSILNNGLTTVDGQTLFSTTHTTANGDVYSNIINIAATAAAATPVDIETAVQDGMTALFSQKDEDGLPMDAGINPILLTSADLFIKVSKAVTTRGGVACCDANGVQFVGTAGLTVMFSNFLTAGSMYLINENAGLVRDVVKPLQVRYLDGLYQDNWESVYRGRFIHRYFAYRGQGIIKFQFA